MCEGYYLHGTSDEIIGQIEEFARIGMKHVVLCNMTFFFDIRKVGSSFGCMKRVVEYFKG